MKYIRFAGWALILSSVLELFVWVWLQILGQPNSFLIRVIGLAGVILFLVGLPAIQETQPQTDRWGQVGLALMGAAALIAIYVTLVPRTSGSALDDALPFASALIGLAGRILVGGLTIRQAVFPFWVGALLIIGAILNFVLGLFPVGGEILTGIAELAGVIAIGGYGATILRKAAGAVRSAPMMH